MFIRCESFVQCASFLLGGRSRGRVIALSSAVSVVVALTCPAVARAATVRLNPDRDNTLFLGTVFDLGAQDLSSGAGPSLFSGIPQVGPRRALVHFDLSPIPPGAVVSDAELTLVTTKSATNGAHLELHALLAEFGEGTSDSGYGGQGAPATPGDSTWLHRIFPDIPWTTPGGDFAPSVSASVDVSGAVPYTWSGPGLVQDVQAWVQSPADNFGWILLEPNTANIESGQRFGSRENPDETVRPVLTITYGVAPAVPASSTRTNLLAATALGMLGAALVRRARR